MEVVFLHAFTLKFAASICTDIGHNFRLQFLIDNLILLLQGCCWHLFGRSHLEKEKKPLWRMYIAKYVLYFSAVRVPQASLVVGPFIMSLSVSVGIGSIDVGSTNEQSSVNHLEGLLFGDI